MNDPLFSRLSLPEPCQVALYLIDETLSLLATQRDRLLTESPAMCGLPAFSVALDTFDEAFQALLESQEQEEKAIMNEPTHERDTRYLDEATTLLARLADTDNWHLKEVELLAARSLFDVVQNSWKEVAWRLDQMTLCKREGTGEARIEELRKQVYEVLPTQQYVVCWCEGTRSYALALKVAMSQEHAE